ncbi:MAG: sigma-70 family RNA polymerase sigma factor [Planctomycetes bacterium]|nr:sigma-70 family RNA polymerase sigma factor [Planctomycetota bacterium]
MTEPERQAWISERLDRWRSNQDAAALGELLKWQRDRAYATSARLLGAGPDAEDAVQQAFLKLLSRRQGFEHARAFQASVYRAVVQCALDLARARQTRSQREADMRNVMQHAGATPAALAEQAELQRLLREAFGSLDPQQQALVTLCCQEGLTLADAAAVLEIPRETARDRFARALNDLHGFLRKRGVALSLLLLAGLFQSSSVSAAPSTLCAALDASLPGRPCVEVAAAAQAPAHAARVLTEAGLSGSTWGFQVAAAALVLVCGGLAAGLLWNDPPKDHGQAPVAPVATVDKEGAQPAPSGQPGVDPLAAAEKSAQPAAEAPAAPAPGPQAEARAQPGDGLPPGIEAAAVQALEGFVLERFEREVRAGGVRYELEGTAGGKRYEIVVSAEAKVLKIEEEDEDDDDDEKSPAKPPPAPPDDF